MKSISRTGGRRAAGHALLISLIALTAMMAIAGAFLASSVASKAEIGASVQHTRALYAAEAGVGQALMSLTASQSPVLGTEKSPLTFGEGAYWGSAVDNLDGTWTVTSVGQSGGAKRAIQAVLEKSGSGVYENAVFAGNSSKDPAYVMKFGGKGTQADALKGNIYSGGGVSFTGDATINGTVRAYGDITVQPGSIVADPGKTPAAPVEGNSQPIPDIAGMKYETIHDVNVAAALSGATATYKASALGGTAWQVPATNPAHIFRKNPTDRAVQCATTSKNDYFLEDPFQTVHTDPDDSGKDCTMIQLTDSTSGKNAVDGNKKVYYVDGNLWVNNLKTHSFKFKHPQADGIQINIVVKGNIYFADNLFYLNKTKDAVAFIAMKDSKVKDSGNVYFGDPDYGTLKNLHAFVYAENNFYDNNLDEAGSKIVSVFGNMSAGNQVLINRDYGKQHSKMTVDFDNRVWTKTVTIPGLPTQTAVTSSCAVKVWREVAVP